MKQHLETPPEGGWGFLYHRLTISIFISESDLKFISSPEKPPPIGGGVSYPLQQPSNPMGLLRLRWLAKWRYSMTKSKPTVASLTTEVAEIKDAVAQLVALFTEPTKAAEVPTKTTKKPNKKARKSNGNKWLVDLGQGFKVMKDQGSTAKNRAVFAEHQKAGVPLMLQKADGSQRTWNAAS